MLEALRRYKRPVLNEIHAVSNVLQSAEARLSFDAELEKTYTGTGREDMSKSNCAVPFMHPLFGNVTNCTINISPHNAVTNFHTENSNSLTVEEDIRALQHFSLDQLYSD